MDDIIRQRIRRIYASIGAITEEDTSKLKATVIKNDKMKSVFQDFRGGSSDDELFNQAHMAISNIACLQAHLCKWATQNGQDKTKIDQAVHNCPEIQIILDLWNSEKHPYPPRNGGHSGKSPRLVAINRVMQLQTQAQKGSAIVMTLGVGGVPKLQGDGTAKAVVTSDVVDGNNKPLGDLYRIMSKAIEAWEHLLVDFGLS